jgi:predicted lipoprotein with Yx(FWY)xxD motif
MTQMTASFKALLMAAALTLPGFAMAAEPAMMKDGMMVDHKGMTFIRSTRTLAASRCAAAIARRTGRR